MKEKSVIEDVEDFLDEYINEKGSKAKPLYEISERGKEKRKRTIIVMEDSDDDWDDEEEEDDDDGPNVNFLSYRGSPDDDTIYLE